jgi:hypothetical protein
MRTAIIGAYIVGRALVDLGQVGSDLLADKRLRGPGTAASGRKVVR